jgi:hypothetical protein
MGMKIVEGSFGKQKDATLQEKLAFVVSQFGESDEGNFVLVTDDGQGNMNTATDLPLTEVIYMVEMLKISLLLDTGDMRDDTVH